MKQVITLRSGDNHRGRRNRLVPRLVLSTCIGFVSTAQAGNVFNAVGDWTKQAVKDVGEAAGATYNEAKNAVGTIVETGNPSVNAVTDFSDEAFNEAAQRTLDGYNEASKLAQDTLNVSEERVEELALFHYAATASDYLAQINGPLENFGGVWTKLLAEKPTEFNELKVAIQNRDGSAIGIALLKVFQTIGSYTGFDAIIKNFEDKNAGSLILIVSSGGGLDASGNIDTGIAIDIDAVPLLINGQIEEFKGPIASLFTTAGILVQIDPTVGGNVNFVVGYDTADLNGVHGPGMDIGVQDLFGDDVSFVSYDFSQAPPQVVSVGMGVGVGAVVQRPASPSYAFVLGQLCSNLTFHQFVDPCPKSTEIANWSWENIPGKAKDIGVGAEGSVWVINTIAANGGYGINRWTDNKWTSIPGAAVRLAVDPQGNPWIVKSSDTIHHWTGSSWNELPGAAKDIGVGSDGSVWVIGTNIVEGGYGVHQWKDNKWNTIVGGAVRIAVDQAGNPWVVNSSGTIHRWTGNRWKQLPGAAKDIGVGANGTVWITNDVTESNGNRNLYWWDGSGAWQKAPGSAVNVAVDPSGKPWIVRKDGAINVSKQPPSGGI